MEREFWLERWEMNQIGFHKDQFNQNLLNHYSDLSLKEDDHILVPLCGKSLDMIWLAKQGLKVTGIELSEIAIKEFFTENKLDYTIEEIPPFKKYTSHNITIFEGDIFELTTNLLGPIHAVYDRASTVALPDNLRSKFMDKLKELNPKLNILMVLFNYDQELVSGPPFSVSDDFIYSHFDKSNLSVLKNEKLHTLNPKFEQSGAEVFEKIFLIRS